MNRSESVSARVFAALVTAATFAFAAPAGGTTFVVNSVSDASDVVPGDGLCNAGGGQCTLRAAIEEANATPGADVINFNIPTFGAATLTPTTALPPLTEPAVIDGFTQPGASPNTHPFGQGTNAALRIEINGRNILSSGLDLKAGNSTVRGLVINRSGYGIFVESDNNVIEGNFLGTSPNGRVALNNVTGIALNGSNNRIGGTAPAARNIISASTSYGVLIDGESSQHNEIVGNFIGTNAPGTGGLGNQFSGVELRSPNNAIRMNLISGNGTYLGPGINLGTSGNVIQGNFIGTDVTGSSNIGNNRSGIDVGGSDNTIGGPGVGEGNIIAFNRDVFGQSGAGVDVHNSAVHNRISCNSIFRNTGLGIELSTYGIDPGVNPNDPGDVDEGANGFQNYPDLLVAGQDPTSMTIIGTLSSQPSTTYRLEFFRSVSCDGSGHGQGQFYIGASTVTTDAGGSAAFAAQFGAAPADGAPITATATDPQGNTSEFSSCVTLLGSPPLLASVSVGPEALNLHSMGKWITVVLEPPAPYTASQIDVSSLRLNGVAVDPSAPVGLGDDDDNGIADLAVKFDRGAVELALPEGPSVTVTVTGLANGNVLFGTDHIKVFRVGVTKPAAGSVLSSGSLVPVQWETPSGIQAESVAILWSYDAGVTWTLVARDLPNTGSYLWQVPLIGGLQTARVAVALVESADDTGYLVTGVVGMSQPFTILGTVGVGDDRRAEFAIHRIAPNPSHGALFVDFSLADAGPARMELLDVAGRRVLEQDLGSEPGGHHIAVRKELHAGVYLVRLTQGDRIQVERVTVLE